MASLESLFRSGDSKRDNFLSRVFGIFNEEVVRHWCANTKSKYVDLGRPTLHTADGRWHTLDFTFRDPSTSKVYVAEMKCELAYDNYRYLRLTGADQLDHHRGAAFVRFLETAKENHELIVKVGAKPLKSDGAILVWGATTPQGVAAVKQATNVTDVLSLEDMIADLQRWQDAEWKARSNQIRTWCDDLFDFMEP